MRRYVVKIEWPRNSGNYIHAENLVKAVSYYYMTLEEANIVASLIRDEHDYKTRVDVVSN